MKGVIDEIGQSSGRKKRYFVGIRTKLIVSFILLLFIVMAFLDVAVYEIYKSDIEHKEMTSMEDASEILADNIKNLLGGLEEKFVNEVRQSDLFWYLTEDSELLVSDMERKLRGFGILLHFRGLECENVMVIDHNGSEFFCNYEKDGISADEFRQRAIYKRMQEEKENLFPARGYTIWRSCTDYPDEIYIIKSYVDSVSLKYCGIVCITIDREYFSSLLGEHYFDIDIYDEENSFLFSSTGKRVIHKMETEKEHLHSETRIDRSRGDWKMISYISRKIAFRDLSAVMRMLILTELLLGVVVVCIVYKITKGFLWNITALTENFKQIHKQGNIEKIYPHSHDETTYLCEQFDSMYRQMQENAEQVILTSTLLDKAEYSALLAQINPHFLYNSLESISAMARLKGQEEIVRTIHMLSSLLRGVLNSGEQEISLLKELEYISCYLEMQSLITGGRISWDIEVDEVLWSCKVPRLILQPIVENSILHGLDEVLDDAVIIITADIRDDKLVLTVSDNGKGAEQSVLDALLSNADVGDYKNQRVHIGIQSVLKRIQILYGNEYGMTMESELEKGMTVRIYLPYEKNENIGSR